jgi:hypothetical protein
MWIKRAICSVSVLVLGFAAFTSYAEEMEASAICCPADEEVTKCDDVKYPACQHVGEDCDTQQEGKQGYCMKS